jgi:hypothetical protein
VLALVGEVAAYVKPAPRAAVQPQGAPRQRQSQGGQAGNGRSQGANAQRKRANRDGAPKASTGGSRNFYSTGTGDAPRASAPRGEGATRAGSGGGLVGMSQGGGRRRGR